MVDQLAQNWGWMALRGVAAVIFGLLAIFNPLLSLALLVLFFGAYCLVDGAFTAVAAVAHRKEQPYWGSLLVSGLLGLLIGVLALFWPGVTSIALVYIIAVWAIIVGLGEIFSAIRLREEITNEWLMVLVGALSVLFGVALALYPGAGAVALVWWIGIFAVVAGILRIVLAFRLRSWQRQGAVAT